MYGTHTLAFQRIFVRMKIISLIFIRFSYVSLIRNSVTGPLTPICKKAFWISARSRFGVIRALIKMSQSSGCKDGPVNIYSLILLANGTGLALASTAKSIPNSKVYS